MEIAAIIAGGGAKLFLALIGIYGVFRLARRCDRKGPDATVSWVAAATLDDGWEAEVGPQRDREPGGSGLRAVTYNVHGAARPDRIAFALSATETLARADVVFLQEVDCVQSEICCRARVIADALELNYAYAPARLFAQHSQGLAILSRRPLYDIRVLELKRWTTNFRLERRIALSATVLHDGKSLLLINTHLDVSVNPGHRSDQFAPVLETCAAHDGPVLIGADVNTNPFLWLERTLPVFLSNQRSHLNRAVQMAGLSTPTMGLGRTHWTGCKLDTFYARSIEVNSAGVERSVRLSDHYPVWLRAQPVR